MPICMRIGMDNLEAFGTIREAWRTDIGAIKCMPPNPPFIPASNEGESTNGDDLI